MLINNINYLRENYPEVRKKLKPVEEEKDKKFCFEKAKNGSDNLFYQEDNKQIYFHSKYNPEREAQALIEKYKEVKDKTIIFYGTALGYHIDLLMTEAPDNSYYIFEPIPELLEAFLSKRDLTLTKYKNLKNLSMGMEDILETIDGLIELNRKEIYVIELPVHKQIFESEYKVFHKAFIDIVRGKRVSILTDYGFQRRWIINSMKNFKEVIRTPNIILENKDKFQGKPVILVSAGPSLNYEIENIKYIKENKLAYIISVGSAINTLLYHDIHPDATTTYDPKGDNQIVFKTLKEKNIKDIPVIFGSSVGYETIENYPGEMYHMITSQDKVANYFLEDSDNDMDIVLDAPSIAVVTLQLLVYLGFGPIILVGQNLAYVGERQHADGVDYSVDLTEEQIKDLLKVESVEGEELYTNKGYNSMRRQLELYISGVSEGRVINTTRGGAKIEGAEFVSLKELMNTKLNKEIVDKSWLKQSENEYNKKLLKEKQEKLDAALVGSYKSIKEYNLALEKIFLLVKNKNFNQIEQAYQKLDISIEELETNTFFTTFILQMNRVQHKLLADAVKISKLEKNIYKKNIDLLNAYRVFINQCMNDIEAIKPIYEEMKKDILNYITKK